VEEGVMQCKIYPVEEKAWLERWHKIKKLAKQQKMVVIKVDVEPYHQGDLRYCSISGSPPLLFFHGGMTTIITLAKQSEFCFYPY
jgi:hypothetical protein